MQCSIDGFSALAALLAGSPRDWADLHLTDQSLLDLCRTEDLSALCFHRLSQSGMKAGWPARVHGILAETARVQAGEELLRGAETRAVVDALTGAGVNPILIKGTPLAYTVYDAPALRPREDTDLLVAHADVDLARRALTALGYSATVQCHDLFSQFEMQKVDRFGVCHVFDVHWRISTQPVFADVLTYREMLPRAAQVPALGPAAVAPHFVDAMLLACIHPVMHHQNAQRMLWTYDVHLLASRLTPDDFADFVRRARRKRVAAVCAHQLRLTRNLFETDIPAGALAELSAATDEPSADYLASQRRWHHELASSIRGLPRFGDRVKLLRDVLLPSPGYMLSVYGLRGKPLAPWLLPALYAHRNLRGAWKILTGKK